MLALRVPGVGSGGGLAGGQHAGRPGRRSSGRTWCRWAVGAERGAFGVDWEGN